MQKYIFIIAGLLFSLFVLFVLSLPDRNLHVVFCDVGQGDAAVITYGTVQMVIDGGPDASILSCLARSTPFWDRTVEVVIVTHPQEDHYGGIIDLARSYSVKTFVHPGVDSNSAGWETLQEELKRQKVVQKTVTVGDSIRYSSLLFEIHNPLLGYISKDINEQSIVGTLSFGDFDVLLTGDIIPPVIDEVASRIKDVEVLKVPHHGSKNGLTQALLDASGPELAVISVGKNNRHGHPHEETLAILRNEDSKILRTDVDGTIEVISDGKKWWVRRLGM